MLKREKDLGALNFENTSPFGWGHHHLAALFPVLMCMTFSCARLPVMERSQAMRPLKAGIVSPLEQGDLESLKKAVREQIEFWQSRKNGTGDLVFGPVTVSRREYEEALVQFLSFLETGPNREGVDQFLKDSFRFLKSMEERSGVRFW